MKKLNIIPSSILPSPYYPIKGRAIRAIPSNAQALKFIATKPTGEYRRPVRGEWYLSGAEPEAYQASSTLSLEYYIAELVVLKKVIQYIEVEE